MNCVYRKIKMAMLLHDEVFSSSTAKDYANTDRRTKMRIGSTRGKSRAREWGLICNFNVPLVICTKYIFCFVCWRKKNKCKNIHSIVWESSSNRIQEPERLGTQCSFVSLFVVRWFRWNIWKLLKTTIREDFFFLIKRRNSSLNELKELFF